MFDSVKTRLRQIGLISREIVWVDYEDAMRSLSATSLNGISQMKNSFYTNASFSLPIFTMKSEAVSTIFIALALREHITDILVIHNSQLLFYDQ